MRASFTAFLMSLLLAAPANAFSISTWNAAGASIENITGRQDDLNLLGAALRKVGGSLPEVLVLQEVTSYAAARRIADGLGYKDATIITTDVGDDKEIWPFALEIAIITTRPVNAVDVYQPIRKKYGKPIAFRQPFIEDQKSGKLTKGRVSKVKVPSDITKVNSQDPARGLLRVSLNDDIVVYGVHLKSSGLAACRAWQVVSDAYSLQRLAEDFGLYENAAAIQTARDAISAYTKKIPETGVPAIIDETLRSASNREAAAGAIGLLATSDISSGKSVFVAGDFNTPVEETCKSGLKLEEDATPELSCARKPVKNSCGKTDGFDDTYGILTQGLVGSPKFKILSRNIKSTYVKTGFADSPIDNILVAGDAAKWSYSVEKIVGPKVKSKVFGSDHYAVHATTK